ncbi:WecB/TagA/CpsF family glycosyltransferase [Rhodoplanes roseus]|uniref:WecB/TagA/CpsF family glycosyltransferase n=1 Tax=Rhodoplanes roseus TaxID=29409 RepID=UPI0014735AC5|nr:WecB/TagA/CpsF family glycosyltransferase [Rhodoplanes roseus]
MQWGATAAETFMKAVFGLAFSSHTQSELVDKLAREKIAPGAGPRTILTANLDHVVRLRSDHDFRDAYDRAWAVTADGVPVLMYAKVRGARELTRVTGSDLVSALLPVLDPDNARLFFVVGDATTADRLRDILRARGFESDAVVIEVAPRDFGRDRAYSGTLTGRIRGHRTTHLFMGLGAPKSEVWVHRHRDRLGDCYVLPVGAGLEFVAGTKRRAPVWMRGAGLEWAWRLGSEPRRLWRRYLVDSWLFLGAIGTDLMAPDRGSARSTR